jgi:[NiFe] hydrogenase diaphorase moiety large subunit
MTADRKGPVIFSPIGLNDGLKRALELTRPDVLEMVRDSNLRGRGGAGFPTGVKWNLAATSVSDKKFVVCNADEGEPGTFKDRIILKEYPRLMLEGMIIGAYAIGAEKGFLYLRGEYKSFIPELEDVLKTMRSEGVLGQGICGKQGFNFDIELRHGVGAYICGEETALIESMEGNRGESRNRPPFPVNTGYEGHPTIVNNVETFAAVTHIIAKGPDWFKQFGTEISAGSKLLSVSGDCGKPGVYEVEFGITIAQMLDMVDAQQAIAVQIGGASGTCVAKKDFDRKICYEDLSTGGSVIIFGPGRNLLDVAQNFLEFFEDESCGQCTPCREGIPVLIECLEQIKNGTCTQSYFNDIRSLCETMQIASKCGLGQSVPNAFLSILDNFKSEYALAPDAKAEELYR